ncbi:MAG: hypothetical protein VKL97_04285 [Cyanobacteriota bacterium]|nr:hypothetical protein [Cyanobacteriota bacterium]
MISTFGLAAALDGADERCGNINAAPAASDACKKRRRVTALGAAPALRINRAIPVGFMDTEQTSKNPV